MYSKYYQQELYNIRELAREFAELHPAIAPMLSGQSTDPDVERLLEGTAFLTGLLRQKLDDSFPEVIHFLIDLIFPHFLRPIPSLTLIRFVPRPGMPETINVPAGTTMRSAKVDGSSCVFRTSFPCDVHPLRIVKIDSDDSGHTPSITLHLEMISASLEGWLAESLSFFMGGSFTQASGLFMLLNRRLERIILSGDDGDGYTLRPDMLKAESLDRANSLLPYPSRSFAGYRLLQEYFILPHKFLNLSLHGISKWRNRGNSGRFTITFVLKKQQEPLPKVNRDSFILSTVPAVNLFSHEAEPVLLDHRLDKIRVVPAMHDGQRPEVYTVDKVTGFSRGAVKKKEYIPEVGFTDRGGEGNTYSQIHSISAVHDRPEVALRFSYPPEAESLIEETLTVRLTCSNGLLPVQLQQGEINLPTSDTPELVDFSNLMQPTQPIDPPLEGNTLWQLLSHLSLNLFNLTDADSLRNLLRLYIFSHGHDRSRVTANEKRLEGIEEFVTQPVNRLVRGVMMRGQRIDMVIRADNFAGLGDFNLFGMVLDGFFSEYAAMNNFTQLNVKNSNSGEVFTWPPRLGTTRLL